MDEIMNYSSIDTVEELTNVINNELHKAAISFVRVGYLLKRARDEDILKNSGYPDIYVYANTKFGLDKSQVSRFMRINDRYSIGGYSEHLKEEYEGFGYSKLALMLTLPDEINEELSPEYSKSEINAIKAEYEAEQKISDMEVMMEEKRDEPDEFVAMIVKEMNDEHPGVARYFFDTMRMAEKLGVEPNEADIKDAYIPEGTATYDIRIPGQGTFMITMKDDEITILNMRSLEKSPLGRSGSSRTMSRKRSPRRSIPRKKRIHMSKRFGNITSAKMLHRCNNVQTMYHRRTKMIPRATRIRQKILKARKIILRLRQRTNMSRESRARL